MELIITPPRIAIRFRVSLLHNLLTIAGFWHLGNRLEGLSDWIRQQPLHKGTPQLNSLNMLILFATGTQGYLVNTVPRDDPANVDFEALWKHVQALKSSALQMAVFQALHEYLIRLEILDSKATLPSSLETVVDQLIEQYQERWENVAPMSSREFVRLIQDPQALHQALLDGLWYIWHEIYRDQATKDFEQIFAAEAYHNSKAYHDDFPAVFRSVTGRTLPDYLSKHLNEVTRVELIPACHLGPYITVSILGNHWWIGFNAHLVPVNTDDEIANSIVELFPTLRALADETRLKIVSLLVDRELNVGEIADTLHLTQSTASRHLSLLAKTDILVQRRDGVMRYYSLNPQTLTEISTQLQRLSKRSSL